MEIRGIAWLAGLLEGEGTFVCQPNGGGYRGCCARVCIQMTDKDVLQDAISVAERELGIDARVCEHKTRPSGWGKKPMYSTGWNGPRAETLMAAIRPYMGERRGSKIDSVLSDVGEYRALKGVEEYR